MICACTVTSSAVVGSSAIRTSRVQRERHRDHDALAHAAGELVRVVVDPLPAAGMRTRSISSTARCLASFLRAPAVHAEHLADLAADAVDRVQRRQRVLEDHRDAAGRGSAAAPPPTCVEQVAALGTGSRRR